MVRKMVLMMSIMAGVIIALGCGSADPLPTSTPYPTYTPYPTPTPISGVLLPYPEEGEQYRMSEVCQHLEEQGYNVKGTVHHKVYADDLSGLIALVPTIVREPFENYLANGVGIEIEVRSLCQALNE